VPRLLEYDPAEFEQYLITHVFDGIDTYVELVRASEGNPRDFLSLLDQCLSSQRPDAGKRINQRDVQTAAGRYFSGSKSPEIQDNEAAMDSFEQLYDKVVREKKEKLFLMSTRLAQKDV